MTSLVWGSLQLALIIRTYMKMSDMYIHQCVLFDFCYISLAIRARRAYLRVDLRWTSVLLRFFFMHLRKRNTLMLRKFFLAANVGKKVNGTLLSTYK